MRPLFNLEPEEPALSPNQNQMEDRAQETKRVLKRIATIIDEHQKASKGLNITIGETEICTVIAALRDHAKGGSGELALKNEDEIYAHCLQRLFEELVEEPSNILYTTKTGANSMRYDAMDSRFWIECLDQLELKLNS